MEYYPTIKKRERERDWDGQVAQLVRAWALGNRIAGSIPTWASELCHPQLE